MTHARMLEFPDGSILSIDGVNFSIQSPAGHYYIVTPAGPVADFLRAAFDAYSRGQLPPANADLPHGVNTVGITQTDPTVELLSDKPVPRELDARVSLGLGAERHTNIDDTRYLTAGVDVTRDGIDVTTLDGGHAVIARAIDEPTPLQYRVVKGSNFDEPYFPEEWVGEATIDPVAAEREVAKLNGDLPHFKDHWYRVVKLPYTLSNPEDIL